MRQQADKERAGARWTGNSLDLVFTSEFGAPLNGRNVLRGFQTAAKRVGVTLTNGESVGVHSLRHVAATRLLEGGIPMYVVSRVLGHDSIDTTVNIYGHVVDEQRFEAMAFLGSLVSQENQ